MPDMYLCIQSAAAAAAAALCVAILLLLLLLPLLAADVRHRVLDGNNCRRSLNLTPVFLSLHSNIIYFSMYPSAVLSHSRPRFAYTTSSVISGMRGAKGYG